MDCSLPSSSVHGISQERIPEWVAISFSKRDREEARGCRATEAKDRRVLKKWELLAASNAAGEKGQEDTDGQGELSRILVYKGE